MLADRQNPFAVTYPIEARALAIKAQREVEYLERRLRRDLERVAARGARSDTANRFAAKAIEERGERRLAPLRKQANALALHADRLEMPF